MAAVQLLDLDLYDDASLQAYYTLEDVNDDKNSNNLTNEGTTPFNAAKFGNGADGGASDNNRSLSIASALGYTSAGSYSVSFWVKLGAEIGAGIFDFFELAETTNDTSLLLSYEYNSGTRRLNGGKLRNGAAADFAQYNVTLGTTDFHHMALVKDGTDILIYLNGVEVATTTSVGNGTANLTTGFRLLAGRTLNSNNTFGIIDDMALFSRALTPAEISLIYNGPAVPGGGSPMFFSNGGVTLG